MSTKLQCGMRVVLDDGVPRTGTIEEVTVLGEGRSRAEIVRVLLDEPTTFTCGCGACKDVPIWRISAASYQVRQLVVH